MTVQTAIRTLRDEGFVRSLVGSGVYVREQASLPGPEDAEHPLAGAAAFLFEMGQLKNQPRSGWQLLGIQRAESVAEHSFRTATVGITLASIAGADIARTAALCTLHDAHETRIGDVPAVGRAYVTTATPEAVTAHQTAGMPADAGKAIQELIAEYEDNQTPEAHLAHDADKIEMLIQAIEYEASVPTSGNGRTTPSPRCGPTPAPNSPARSRHLARNGRQRSTPHTPSFARARVRTNTSGSLSSDLAETRSTVLAGAQTGAHGRMRP